jgi:hypothetical protein
MRESMEIYPRTATERAMKLQEVLIPSTAGKIKWWQSAEFLGVGPGTTSRCPTQLVGFTSAFGNWIES